MTKESIKNCLYLSEFSAKNNSKMVKSETREKGKLIYEILPKF